MRSETSSRHCEDKFYGNSVTIKLQFFACCPSYVCLKISFLPHVIFLSFVSDCVRNETTLIDCEEGEVCVTYKQHYKHAPGKSIWTKNI